MDYRQTYRHTDGLTYRSTDRRSNKRWTNRRTDRRTDEQSDRLTDRRVGVQSIDERTAIPLVRPSARPFVHLSLLPLSLLQSVRHSASWSIDPSGGSFINWSVVALSDGPLLMRQSVRRSICWSIHCSIYHCSVHRFVCHCSVHLQCVQRLSFTREDLGTRLLSLCPSLHPSVCLSSLPHSLTPSHTHSLPPSLTPSITHFGTVWSVCCMVVASNSKMVSHVSVLLASTVRW